MKRYITSSDSKYYGNMTAAEIAKLNQLQGTANPDDGSQYQIQEYFGNEDSGIVTYFNFKDWNDVQHFLSDFPVIKKDIDLGYATLTDLL